MKVTKNTVVQYRRIQNKIDALRAELKPHRDKLRGLEPGIYKFDGVAPIKIIEQIYTTPDTQEMLRLEPDLSDVRKTVLRKKIK